MVAVFSVYYDTTGTVTTPSKYDGTTMEVWDGSTLLDSGAVTTHAVNPSYVPRLGWAANGNDTKFDGFMSDVSIQNKNIGTSELTSNYNGKKENTDMITSGTEATQ
jgi:hypothetical protein